MKITFEINSNEELLELKNWLNSMPDIEVPPTVDLSKDIEILGFKTRSSNAMRGLNINTIGELIKCTDSKLLTSRCLGRKSLLEIKKVLALKGLALSGG